MSLDPDLAPSPNHSSRKGYDVTGTVIHYTAGGAARGTIRWFQMPESGASAHYVIARDGHVTQMVSLKRRAWHAGTSEMLRRGEMASRANYFTIGVELANCGLLVEDGAELFWEAGRKLIRYRGPNPVQATLVYDNGAEVSGWWEPYDDRQIEALQRLVGHLATNGYAEAAANLVGHEEIAMPFARRKMDPGPLFPWERFSRKSPRRTDAVRARVATV